MKNYCASKLTTKTVKRQKFANHIYDKGLISRIYKKHLQLKNSDNNNLI